MTVTVTNVETPRTKAKNRLPALRRGWASTGDDTDNRSSGEGMIAFPLFDVRGWSALALPQPAICVK
jgi:hypothetical protein